MNGTCGSQMWRVPSSNLVHLESLTSLKDPVDTTWQIGQLRLCPKWKMRNCPTRKHPHATQFEVNLHTPSKYGDARRFASIYRTSRRNSLPKLRLNSNLAEGKQNHAPQIEILIACMHVDMHVCLGHVFLSHASEILWISNWILGTGLNHWHLKSWKPCQNPWLLWQNMHSAGVGQENIGTPKKNYFTSCDPHPGLLSDIFWHSIWHIFWHSICHSIWQTFWHSTWHSIWHIFWHSIWHSFWHIFWHSIWNIFWNSIWHCIYHSIWQTFWHSIWHSIWHLFWHSICNRFWQSNYLTFYLAFYLTYILTFYLAFNLTHLLTFYLR